MDHTARLKRIAACQRIVFSKEVVNYLLNHPQSKVAAKIIHDIELLDQFGLYLPADYIHRIWGSKERLWELRTRLGNYYIRTLFFVLPDDRFLLTNSFQKKGGKIPVSEIRRAEKILRDYLESA